MKIFLALYLVFCHAAYAAETYKLNRFEPFGTVHAYDKDGVLQEYPTGYRPELEDLIHRQYRDFTLPMSGKAVEPIPQEYTVLNDAVPRVFAQQCGDCWANGSSTAWGTNVNFLDQVSIYVSRQAIIDCSGYGSCGGGQISLGFFSKPKGAVYESDYPYAGRTQRCKSQSLIYHQASDNQPVFIKPLTVSNLQRAVLELGALETCGASGSLRNGGWIDRNYRGGTDHCYALVGWYAGSQHGHKDLPYFIFVNSWGSNWGDNGRAYIAVAQDGEHLDGSVITEAAGLFYKSACAPQPKADAGPDQSILVEG